MLNAARSLCRAWARLRSEPRFAQARRSSSLPPGRLLRGESRVMCAVSPIVRAAAPLSAAVSLPHRAPPSGVPSRSIEQAPRVEATISPLPQKLRSSAEQRVSRQLEQQARARRPNHSDPAHRPTARAFRGGDERATQDNSDRSLDAWLCNLMRVALWIGRPGDSDHTDRASPQATPLKAEARPPRSKPATRRGQSTRTTNTATRECATRMGARRYVEGNGA